MKQGEINLKRARLRRQKVLSIVLSILFLSGMFFGNPAETYAAEPTVTMIMLAKEHTSIENPNAYYLTIIGTADSNFDSVPVRYLDKFGKLITLENRSGGGNIIQFEIDPTRIGATLFIGTQMFNISEMDMGKITSLNPRAIKKGEPISIEGINFDKLDGTNNKVFYYNEVTEVEFSNTLSAGNSLTINNTGLYNIRFDKQFTDNGADITISYRYVDIFRVYDDLDNVSDPADITMFPNRGEKGSRVYFKADQLKQDISVFFLEKDDGTSTFTQDNKGTNLTYEEDAEGTLDIVTVNIPQGLQAGKEYFVFLTNYIPDKVDPETVIYKQLKLLQKFTVIDVDDKVKIVDLEPDHGPDTGTSVEIAGRYLGTLNITGLVNNNPLSNDKIKISADKFKLTMEYGDGKYNEAPVTDITRTVTVYIGNSAPFEEESRQAANFTSDMDRIYIKTPTTFIQSGQSLKENVQVSTVTTFRQGGILFSFEEFDEYDGFTFEASQTKPIIERVLPGKIQVEQDGAVYKIKEQSLFAIYGKDFKIYRETDENNNVVIRYPIVRIKDNNNNEIVINPNIGRILDCNGDPVEDELGSIVKPAMQVFDSNGEELDGSSGKDSGVKILAVLPEGTLVSEPQPSEAPRDVEVVNPVKNSAVEGLKFVALDIVSFVITDKNPVIENVAPDIVPIDGGDQVTITGSNFREGVKVFIDGEAVSGIKRDGTGKTITFRAPPGREGETQLQVLNPEGGIAVWPFKYVRTYTDPKITDFSPKSGSTGTLVVFQGENFMKPDTTSGDTDIFKLIGTRVIMGNEDINIYNRDSYHHIQLVDYVNNVEKLIQAGTTVQLADFYDSVLLYVEGSDPKQYYTLDKKADGTVQLSDGVNNTYIIESSGGALKARREGGGIYDLTVNDNGLDIGTPAPITLIMQTPYIVNTDNRITGKRARVINNNEIHFTVPILPADGYYDLTVVNPDTKSDSRTGNQGFYYYGQPQSNPIITEIIPAEGSTLGGYSIEIHGTDFKDDGQKKSRVIINGIEVSADETEVSIEGNLITVIVPPYAGDLWKDKGTGSLAVPIVVINPDGASFSKEDGFTYIVPTSYPEIIKIVPVQGTAAGGDIVEITGRDFRFYEPFDDKNRDRTREDGEPYTDLNNNGRWDDLRDYTGAASLRQLYEAAHQVDSDEYPEYDIWFNKIIRPILPRVFFDRTIVEVTEFSDGYLKVISPAAPAGQVNVMVVNNDSGVSNQVPFTFEGSSPRIDRIVPGQGSKFGRENAEVYGSGFFPSTIEIYDSLTTFRTKEMPLLRFGDIMNRDIPREQDNSGRIDNQRTTVKLDGGLTVFYDASNSQNIKLTVNLEQNNKTYTGTFTNYDNQKKYLDMGLLLAGTGDAAEAYPGYELIQIDVQDRRLLVERGYSPSVTMDRATQMTAVTPSYYAVGTVPVTLINADGATAESEFEYKNPASNPVIVNITRDGKSPEEMNINGQEIMVLRMNISGESIVTVLGQDFRENASIEVSNILTIEPSDITYILPTKLTFTMPEIDESEIGKLHRVVVMNEDGGVACSDEPPSGQKKIYIQFTKGESGPQITQVSPNSGPAAGGTVVKIEGSDFRGRMEGYSDPLSVYFGNIKIPGNDIEITDYKTIYVKTPVNSPGSTLVKVENPDGEISDPGGEFTYISNPKITAVVDPRDPTENTRIKKISIEGGQEIKLKGSGFMEGCRVIFNPVTSKAADESGSDLIYRIINKQVDKRQSFELDPFVLESGIEGNVTFIDSETITVTTPPGKIDTSGIIVVNPDKGASESYSDLIYDLPEIEAPTGVTAEIVIDDYNDIDRFIRVKWESVAQAAEYEIYVVEDEQVEFLGSTELTAFIYEDLQPRTRYKFIVKAAGDFGSSPPSAESNEVRTGSRVGTPDNDGGLTDNTQMSKNGTTAIITIGCDDHESTPLLIDLTRGDLAGANEVILSIPARVISGRSGRDIEIRGSNFTAKMNPAVFRLSQVRNNSHRDDAGVRFKIAPSKSNNYISGGNNLSPVYVLEAGFYMGKDSSPIKYLASNMSILLDVDTAKASMRRFRTAGIYKYNEQKNTWEEMSRKIITGGAVTETIKQLGTYTVFGSR